MSMYKKICVTNRHLAAGDFLEQIKKVTKSGCDAIILREKDLTETEYEVLAKEVLAIGKKADVPCILHTYTAVAVRLGVKRVHLTLAALLELPEEIRAFFREDGEKGGAVLGVSVHSVQDAVLAYQNGASYVTAGHVFSTDCKKGVPARGLSFLEEVCNAVPIPVYAIGGIDEKKAKECIEAGAAGVCMMSGYMRMQAPE